MTTQTPLSILFVIDDLLPSEPTLIVLDLARSLRQQNCNCSVYITNQSAFDDAIRQELAGHSICVYTTFPIPIDIDVVNVHVWRGCNVLDTIDTFRDYPLIATHHDSVVLNRTIHNAISHIVLSSINTYQLEDPQSPLNIVSIDAAVNAIRVGILRMHKGSKNALKHQFNLPMDDRPLIGTFSRCTYNMGWDLFLEACAHLQKMDLGYRFIFVGASPQDPQYRLYNTIAKELSPDIITFEPLQDVARLQMLSLFDAFLYTQRISGFCYYLYEACVCGTPSAAHELPSVYELEPWLRVVPYTDMQGLAGITPALIGYKEDTSNYILPQIKQYTHYISQYKNVLLSAVGQNATASVQQF